MPTYEYGCTKCGHEFSDFLSMDDRIIPFSQPCPNCKELGHIETQFRTPPSVLVDARFNVKQKGDFKEAMQKIKAAHKHDRKSNIKDY